jgi:hypothetical protein
MKVHPLCLCALALGLMATSCSTGPRPPEPGTPAFLWGAAQQTFKSGDLLKANDNLFEILQTDNDFAAKARIWQIALSAGMAEGAEDLASAYEAGARLNRDHPQPFWKHLTQTRALAGHSALDVAQQIQALLAKGKGQQIALEFPFPPGSAVEPAGLRRVQAGMLMPDADADVLESTMLERGVVQAVCKLVGSPDDPAKTLELFQTNPVLVPRETFLLAAAKILYDESAVFGTNKLDQPQRLRAMYDQALAALVQVPESKETKALTSKIQAALKKMPLT